MTVSIIRLDVITNTLGFPLITTHALVKLIEFNIADIRCAPRRV